MPTVHGNKLKQAGLLIVGGAVGIAGVAAGMFSVPTVDNSGNVRPNVSYVANGFLEVNVTATGGNVKVSNQAKYDAVNIANPLSKLSPSQGSGAITAVHFDMGNNPANVSFDCGLVKAAESGTGTNIFNNLQLGTGATKTFSGAALPLWNGVDLFDCGTLTDPTSSFNARIRIEYRDVYGE